MPEAVELEQAQMNDTGEQDGDDIDQSVDEPGTESDESLDLEEQRAYEEGFSWEASEYVHHHKGLAWYVGLVGVVLVPAIGLALLKYWIELGALLVGGVALLVYANKAPRTLMYELTPEGIAIDGRSYPFSDFRSFSVLPAAEWHSIDLEPARRFRPPVSVLFNTGDLDQIVGHLELHLTRDDQAPDLIDQISRRLRF
jgi:hypothetical protein